MFNISNARRYLVPTTLSRSHQFASDASGGNEIKSWERDRNSLPRDSSRFLELASRGNAKKNFGKRNLKINCMSFFYHRTRVHAECFVMCLANQSCVSFRLCFSRESVHMYCVRLYALCTLAAAGRDNMAYFLCERLTAA